jgi:hypothetical protein
MKKRRPGPIPLKRPNRGLAKAIEAAETLSNLAKIVGVTTGAACRWRNIPIEHVPRVEKITGISRHVLRPDIYGRAP